MPAYAELPASERIRGTAARSLPRLPAPAQAGAGPGGAGRDRLARLDPDVRAMLGGAELSGRDKLGDQPIEAERRRFVRETVAIEGPPERVYDVRDLTLPGPAGPLAARLTRRRPSQAGRRCSCTSTAAGTWSETWTPAKARVGCSPATRGGGPLGGLPAGSRAPLPGSVDDALAGFRWAAEHAGELGVDPARIGVGGDSAGGNLAAAVCLVARDEAGRRRRSSCCSTPRWT